MCWNWWLGGLVLLVSMKACTISGAKPAEAETVPPHVGYLVFLDAELAKFPKYPTTAQLTEGQAAILQQLIDQTNTEDAQEKLATEISKTTVFTQLEAGTKNLTGPEWLFDRQKFDKMLLNQLQQKASEQDKITDKIFSKKTLDGNDKYAMPIKSLHANFKDVWRKVKTIWSQKLKEDLLKKMNLLIQFKKDEPNSYPQQGTWYEPHNFLLLRSISGTKSNPKYLTPEEYAQEFMSALWQARKATFSNSNEDGDSGDSAIIKQYNDLAKIAELYIVPFQELVQAGNIKVPDNVFSTE